MTSSVVLFSFAKCIRTMNVNCGVGGLHCILPEAEWARAANASAPAQSSGIEGGNLGRCGASSGQAEQFSSERCKARRSPLDIQYQIIH